MPRYQPAEREARYAYARRKGLPVVVSEGDSWFDYPMYLNIIDRIDDTRRYAIKRLEFSGDTVANMVGRGERWRGLSSLRAVVENEQPRFVLFSGGGNDIVGDEIAGGIRRYDSTNSPEWHLDTAVWRDLTRYVRAAYVRLIETIGPFAPVFAHGYDNVIPNPKPARYDGIAVAGPWLYDEMVAMEIPAAMQRRIGKAMIGWFNDMLADLEEEYWDTGWFAHIDLRRTLSAGDWQNEIHPTRQGFAKITDKFLAEIDRKLTPTLAAHDEHRFSPV